MTSGFVSCGPVRIMALDSEGRPPGHVDVYPHWHPWAYEPGEFNPWLILEGLCPRDHVRLELREDKGYGWCETCGRGWSATGRRYTIHEIPGALVRDGRVTNPDGKLSIGNFMPPRPAAGSATPEGLRRVIADRGAALPDGC